MILLRLIRLVQKEMIDLFNPNSIVYAAILYLTFCVCIAFAAMSFTDPADGDPSIVSILGPYGLLAGMIIAIRYFVKRDKELRDKLDKKNDDVIKEKDERIKELETEVKEWRKNK